MAEHEHSAADLAVDPLEFETLIADLSSRFVNLPPGEVDREIEDALRRVCELLGIDLAVLWQWSTATPDLLAPTHAYRALEGPQPPEPLRQEQFPWVAAADAGRPQRRPLFAGGAAGGGRRRPGERPRFGASSRI